jgi:hypothetical protein
MHPPIFFDNSWMYLHIRFLCQILICSSASQPSPDFTSVSDKRTLLFYPQKQPFHSFQHSPAHSLQSSPPHPLPPFTSGQTSAANLQIRHSRCDGLAVKSPRTRNSHLSPHTPLGSSPAPHVTVPQKRHRASLCRSLRTRVRLRCHWHLSLYCFR